MVMVSVLGLALAGFLLGFVAHVLIFLFLGRRAKYYAGITFGIGFYWAGSFGLGFFSTMGVALLALAGHLLSARAHQWWLKRGKKSKKQRPLVIPN